MESPYPNFVHPTKIEIKKNGDRNFIWEINTSNGLLLASSINPHLSEGSCLDELLIIGNGLLQHFTQTKDIYSEKK